MRRRGTRGRGVAWRTLAGRQGAMVGMVCQCVHVCSAGRTQSVCGPRPCSVYALKAHTHTHASAQTHTHTRTRQSNTSYNIPTDALGAGRVHVVAVRFGSTVRGGGREERRWSPLWSGVAPRVASQQGQFANTRVSPRAGPVVPGYSRPSRSLIIAPACRIEPHPALLCTGWRGGHGSLGGG